MIAPRLPKEFQHRRRSGAVSGCGQCLALIIRPAARQIFRLKRLPLEHAAYVNLHAGNARSRACPDGTIRAWLNHLASSVALAECTVKTARHHGDRSAHFNRRHAGAHPAHGVPAGGHRDVRDPGGGRVRKVCGPGLFLVLRLVGIK